MGVDAVGHVGALSLDGRSERGNLVLARDVDVLHGPAERNRFGAHGARGLGASALELARLCGFIRGAARAKHLVVGKLDHHLGEAIGRGTELLDLVLAVRLVRQDGQVVFGDQGIKVGFGGFHRLENRIVYVELEFLGCRQVGSNFSRSVVDCAPGQTVAHVLVQTTRRGTVHTRMLAHETGLAIVKHNELQWLVKESVAAIAVPACTRTFVTGHGSGIVQAHDKRRRLDLFQYCLVLWADSQKSIPVLYMYIALSFFSKSHRRKL